MLLPATQPQGRTHGGGGGGPHGEPPRRAPQGRRATAKAVYIRAKLLIHALSRARGIAAVAPRAAARSTWHCSIDARGTRSSAARHLRRKCSAFCDFAHAGHAPQALLSVPRHVAPAGGHAEHAHAMIRIILNIAHPCSASPRAGARRGGARAAGLAEHVQQL